MANSNPFRKRDTRQKRVVKRLLMLAVAIALSGMWATLLTIALINQIRAVIDNPIGQALGAVAMLGIVVASLFVYGWLGNEVIRKSWDD